MVNINIDKYENRTACISEDGELLSYAELIDRSKIFSSLIGQRCLVFILCINTSDCLAIYLGCINSGIVPLLIDGKIKKELLNQYIENFHPKYICAPQDVIPDYCQKENLFGAFKIWSCDKFEEISLNEDLALLIPTSGSTGSQKLVKLSYENLMSNASSIAEYLGIDEQERAITSLPMNYSYGLSVINSHLLMGASLVMTEKAVIQKEFWNLMEKFQVTSMAGVPFIYEMLKRLRIFNKNLPYLKTLTQAGGKLSKDLQKYFGENCLSKGIRFFVMYGQTEATARIAYLPYDKCLDKLGSIGVAIPRGKLYLKDSNDKIIESKETEGELFYEGKNISMGYAEYLSDLATNNENRTSLATGDLAYFDEDGFFYISGRRKRFLKIFGKRINLDETENLLNKEFIDSKFCCTGYDDHLEVYKKDDGTCCKEVALYLEQTLGINKISISIKFVNDFPLSSSGKILYSDLKKNAIKSMVE